ncbi:MAG: hypothetical protein ACOC42_01005, partial [Halobacteriota archaeon]
MDPLCRVLVATTNEGQPGVAISLLSGHDDGRSIERVEELVQVLERLCDVTVHRDYASGGTPAVSLGDRMLHADDLDMAELALGVRLLASQRGDLELDAIDRVQSIAHETTAASGRTRCRLLLEDYLLRPATRAVTIDRMARIAAIDRRAERDVEAVF